MEPLSLKVKYIYVYCRIAIKNKGNLTMAKLLWAQVYYQDQFVGSLREEPGAQVSFAYEESYLDSGSPAIAIPYLYNLQPLPPSLAYLHSLII
jgi:hypothetical protein